jgi:hypothetical protein
MKKLLGVVVVFMLAGSAVFARMDVSGKFMLGINGDAGITILGGTIPGNYEEANGPSYGVGLKAGYAVSNWGVLWGGAGYLHNELHLDDISSGETLKFKQNYIDLNLAFRFLFWKMYADVGALYGIRYGDMKYSYSDGSGSGTVEKKYTKNMVGFLIGLGFLIPIGDSFAIDLGTKVKNSMNYSIDNGYFKISQGMFAFTAGFVKYF